MSHWRSHSPAAHAAIPRRAVQLPPQHQLPGSSTNGLHHARRPPHLGQQPLHCHLAPMHAATPFTRDPAKQPASSSILHGGYDTMTCMQEHVSSVIANIAGMRQHVAWLTLQHGSMLDEGWASLLCIMHPISCLMCQHGMHAAACCRYDKPNWHASKCKPHV